MTNEIVNAEFFLPVQDERYNICTTHRIAIDASSNTIIMSKKPAWNSPSVNGIVNASSKPTQFRVYSSADLRSYLPYFTILVKGHASKIVGGNEVSINSKEVSIDWDPASALIKNCYIRLNSNSEMLENYQNSRYDVAHKVRMLQTLSRQMIEGDDSIFMSPCFETSRDTVTVLSAESQARSRRWLSSTTTAPTAAGIIYHSRSLPLSHLFSSCSIPAYLQVNCIDIVIEFKKYDEILFSTSVDTSANSYIIDDVSIILDQTKMSPAQASIELKELVDGTNVQRMAYPYYEIVSQAYVQSAKLIVPNCVDLQSVAFMFPSTTDGYGVNPLQFILNDISSYSVMYGNMQITDLPLNIDTTNRQTNVELYYYYRKCCHKEFTTNFVPAIPCYEGYLKPFQTLSPRVCDETYAIMWMPLWASDKFHLSPPAQLEIMTNQASTGKSPSTCLICMCRMRAMQINSDTTSESIQ